MGYIQIFDKFKINRFCKEYLILDYTINKDLSVDVNDDVYLSYKNLQRIAIKFNKIEGSFYISYNSLLSTLEGSPNYIVREFWCRNNRLDTLEGGPNYVGGNFNCSNNRLNTLKGSPSYVGGGFYCDSNNILTFEGSPEHIGGSFLCSGNPIWVIWRLFEDYSKVELLNDYDALRIENGRGICILSRLNGFLEDIGKPKVTERWIKEIEKHYEIR